MRSLIPLLLVALAIGGCDRQSPSAEQANQGAPDNPVGQAVSPGPENGAGQLPAEPDNAAVPPAAKAGSIDRSHKGEAAPATAFKDLDGKSHSLAEFKGKPVLLNLWATWCAPCVAEMPSLDALAGSAGAPRVVAISQDFEGKAKVAPFVAKAALKHLAVYLDTDTAFSSGMAVSLPTTLLYDSSGKEVWRTSGGSDWSSAAIKAELAEAK